MHERHRLLSNPSSLVHQNDIRKASELLLADIAEGGRSSHHSSEQLTALMTRLRDGWEPFVVDEYYPHRYTPHQLLGEIYWDVCRQIQTHGDSSRSQLITVLTNTKPVDEGQLRQEFEYAVSHFGLDKVLDLDWTEETK